MPEVKDYPVPDKYKPSKTVAKEAEVHKKEDLKKEKVDKNDEENKNEETEPLVEKK